MLAIVLNCGGCFRLEMFVVCGTAIASKLAPTLDCILSERTRSTVGASLPPKRPEHPPQHSLLKQHLLPLDRRKHLVPVMPHPRHFNQPLIHPLRVTP